MRRLRYLLAAALLGVPLAAGALGAGSAFRDAARSLLALFSRSDAPAARDTNDTPHFEIERLTVENAALRVQEQELRELRALIGFEPPATQRIIPAHIIGMSIDPERRVLFVDRGADQGISAGSPVIGASHWVIGMVDSVDRNRSVVRLITDDATRLSAMLIKDTSIPLLAAGAFGTGVRLTLIPGTVDFKSGEVVVTAGLDPEVPRGLVLGTIAAPVPSNDPPFRAAGLEIAPELGATPLLVGIIQREQ